MESFQFDLPPSLNEARERVKVIASAEQINFIQFSPPIDKPCSSEEASATRVLIEELETISPEIWTETVVSYWIER